MEVRKIVVSRAKARDLLQEYRKHVHYQTPMDAEIQRAYEMISKGRVVIQALESIKAAGLDERGMPRLAIVRADKPSVHCSVSGDGSCRFTAPGQHRGARGQQFNLPRGSFVPPANAPRWGNSGRATTPLIPVHHRPRRGLANYHVLWEAEWSPEPPVDPYLLRQIGGDLWLVVAAWDLTEVERAVMRTRMAS
jgi:hypothetical protein